MPPSKKPPLIQKLDLNPMHKEILRVLEEGFLKDPNLTFTRKNIALQIGEIRARKGEPFKKSSVSPRLTELINAGYVINPAYTQYKLNSHYLFQKNSQSNQSLDEFVIDYWKDFPQLIPHLIDSFADLGLLEFHGVSCHALAGSSPKVQRIGKILYDQCAISPQPNNLKKQISERYNNGEIKVEISQSGTIEIHYGSLNKYTLCTNSEWELFIEKANSILKTMQKNANLSPEIDHNDFLIRQLSMGEDIETPTLINTHIKIPYMSGFFRELYGKINAQGKEVLRHTLEGKVKALTGRENISLNEINTPQIVEHLKHRFREISKQHSVSELKDDMEKATKQLIIQTNKTNRLNQRTFSSMVKSMDVLSKSTKSSFQEINTYIENLKQGLYRATSDLSNDIVNNSQSIRQNQKDLKHIENAINNFNTSLTGLERRIQKQLQTKLNQSTQRFEQKLEHYATVPEMELFLQDLETHFSQKIEIVSQFLAGETQMFNQQVISQVEAIQSQTEQEQIVLLEKMDSLENTILESQEQVFQIISTINQQTTTLIQSFLSFQEQDQETKALIGESLEEQRRATEVEIETRKEDRDANNEKIDLMVQMIQQNSQAIQQSNQHQVEFYTYLKKEKEKKWWQFWKN